MVDGKMKETNDAFLYKGVPYAPVSFVGQAAGKSVGWDAKANTVTMNSNGTGAIGESTRLTALKIDTVHGFNSNTFQDGWPSGSFVAGGVVYDHGLGYNYLKSIYDSRFTSTQQSFTMNLDGKYTKLSGVLAVDDHSPNKTDEVFWLFKGDGKVLFNSAHLKATQTQQIDISVKGVKKLEVEIRKVSRKEKDNNMWSFFGNALLQ
ncbi:hypothetical protein EDM56_26295 [Brevibacillus fluminis]|uniref:Uncharacterized protein n=2 Tax=Brevibacillus fluminis TaxID=511487 RepID=A0A3M8D0Z3_9BACL|nr:hypothetical protein EDM56_26295 [Brevibacillus fluminis]